MGGQVFEVETFLLLTFLSFLSIAVMDGITFGPGDGPPLDFFFFKILLYICVLILAILFYKITLFLRIYKITFCFPLTILLILFRVMLYSQTFL